MAVTLTTRAIGLMLATAVAAGWLAASLTQPDAPAQSAAPAGARRSVEPRPVPQADTLRARMVQPPQPNRGRNPFVYGSRTLATRDHQRHGSEVVAPVTPPEPVAPPLPVFKLSGIAANSENGAAVLTAIIIDNGAMVFVKTGDKLSNGYSVVRVEELSVTIADAAGVTQTLRLP
jgi:hypothetical protein